MPVGRLKFLSSYKNFRRYFQKEFLNNCCISLIGKIQKELISVIPDKDGTVKAMGKVMKKIKPTLSEDAPDQEFWDKFMSEFKRSYPVLYKEMKPFQFAFFLSLDKAESAEPDLGPLFR